MSENRAVIELPGGPARLVKVYLIQGKEKSILVDAGLPGYGKKIFEWILKNGINPPEVNLILLTHGHIDHYGSAQFLKEKTGAKIAIHWKDAEALEKGVYAESQPNGVLGRAFKQILAYHKTRPLKPDIFLEADFNLREYGVEGRVISTPGHTAGSISVILPEGVAIIGDLVIGFPSKKPRYHLLCEKDELRKSIQALIGLSPKIIYAAHGGPFDPLTIKRRFS